MIIDFHTHIFPSEIREKRENFFDGEPDFQLLYGAPGSKLSGVKELIRNMDSERIDKSVVFGFPWQRGDNFKRNNDYIMENVEKYKDRLIGFSAFFPLAKGAEKEAERCIRSGFSGLGELALYNSTLSENALKALMPIFEMAEKLDIPVLMHVNEPVGVYYPGKTNITLKEIYDLLQLFPNNKIILAHWGGGIFFYRLMKKTAKEMLKNVWFDTAASPYIYDKAIYPISIEIMGADKILFGSDFPLLNPALYFEEMKGANLSEDVIKKICGENAELLLE
jgi:predicted TIM-barrel fold metal-dependent hydrolase